MPILIDRNGPIDDRWTWFQDTAADGEAVEDVVLQGEAVEGEAAAAGASGSAATATPRQQVILSLAQWPAHAGRLAAAGATLGVCLEPSDDPGQVADLFDRLALIAIRFPAFTDGRGYSTARLLRQRHGWNGELRAVGDVLRDQMFYLARCGFDTFDLKDGESVADALTGFGDFSEVYQSAVDRGPLFRRRAPATAASAGR